MVSRRTALALLSGTLAGCFGRRSTRTSPDSATRSPTTGRDATEPPPDRNTPPDDWPPAEWTPAWTHEVSVSHIVGLDVVDDQVFLTAHDSSDRTVVQSYDPATRTVGWTQELSGVAVDDSMLHHRQPNRQWGVTDAGDHLLVVTGNGLTPTATTLHALDRETGAVAWSLTRQRALAVRELVDGTVYVLARAFRERSTAHAHGSDTPTPTPREAAVLAVDLTEGRVRWRRAYTGVGAAATTPDGVYLAVMNRLIEVDHDGTERWTVRGDARGKAILPGPDVIYHVAKPEWDRMTLRGVAPDGTVRWRRAVAADEAAQHDGRLYVAGDQLRTIQPDGTAAWTAETHAGRMVFGPSDETVYIRSGIMADAVRAMRTTDGSQQWVFDPPIDNAWPEAVTDETLVAGGIGDVGPDGTVGQPLYRVDAASGTATGRYLGGKKDPLVTQAVDEQVLVGVGQHGARGELLALPT